MCVYIPYFARLRYISQIATTAMCVLIIKENTVRWMLSSLFFIFGTCSSFFSLPSFHFSFDLHIQLCFVYYVFVVTHPYCGLIENYKQLIVTVHSFNIPFVSHTLGKKKISREFFFRNSKNNTTNNNNN